ncbi:structural maintenance of chromosomes protein 1B isoform X6 [Chrysemys picta bellii]|uniref:structural maintenance of chromosomes protein 1B isoform X6 n=1 Tax=Chrysemys picta bellii TaxID=8478 RepID=UPI0032B23571
MGFLKLLLLENFKSWRGRQSIGPFMRFNCIIGPNGSGKSNIMDALSFVMGERTANLRVKSVQELIHGAHIGKPFSSTASVKIVYCEENGEEKTFSRIIRGSCSEFLFNDKAVSRSVYTAELEKIGIIVKARNCMVFQGAVESIAMKKPKERTQLFEQISNSWEFAEEYERKKKKMQQAEGDAQFNYNKKKHVAVERKHAKLEKEEAERYQMLLEELKENRIQLQLFRLYHNEKKIDFLNNKLDEKNMDVNTKEDSLSSAEDTFKAKKKVLGMLNRDQQHMEKEMKTLEASLNQKRPQYIKAKENTSHQIKKVDLAKKSLKDNEKHLAKQEQNIKELDTELTDVERSWRAYEKKVEEEMLQRRADVELEASQLDRYKELKELARKKVATLTQQLEKLQWEQKADLERMTFDERKQKEIEFGRLLDLCHPIHKKYQLAVTKVFGKYMSAIVVATEKIARDCIRFLKEERAEPETFLALDYLDTVSLDGTLFLKSGVISGGSSDLKFKARYWDEKEMKEMKERRDRLVNELKELMKIKRKETDLKQLQAQCQGIQTRLKYSQSELENIKKKHLANFYKEKSKLESELVNIKSQYAMLNEGLLQRTEKIEEFQKKMNEVEDAVFQDFCEEIGVENIRVFEQERVKLQEETDRKRLEFENQKTRLSIQLEYSRGQLQKLVNKIHMLKETIRKDEAEIVRLKKAEEECLLMVNEIMEEQQHLKDKLITLKTEVTKAQNEVEESRKKLLTLNREMGKLQKEAISIETSLEQKRLERHNMLLECKVQDLRISLLLGSLDEISEVELGTEAESTEATADIYERERAIQIDYSSLTDDLTDLQSDKEIEAHLTRLQQQIVSKENVLFKTAAPNLRALEKLQTAKDKFQESVDAFETSRREARICRQEFEQMKKRRYERFSQCFEHVSVAIDQIYKKLCRNSCAQAFLSPENPEEPYLEGISYNCVAPGKRFMPMDNLSGGEKSVAALALVFAIHSFRPAPFFILDEVDAALDNTNIGKVSSFIKEQAQEQCQMIVISLKEEFYSRADALIGVCPEQDDYMFSQVLTLDLTVYPDIDDSERKEKHRYSSTLE